MRQTMKWEKIGEIGVDAGLCWVGDPCYVLGKDSSHGPKIWDAFCKKLSMTLNPDEPLGKGIGFAIPTGYGDGSYPVYIIRNKEGRVMGIKVKF